MTMFLLGMVLQKRESNIWEGWRTQREYDLWKKWGFSGTDSQNKDSRANFLLEQTRQDAMNMLGCNTEQQYFYSLKEMSERVRGEYMRMNPHSEAVKRNLIQEFRTERVLPE